MLFSFIDFGMKDFCRDKTGETIRLEFDSWEEADEFVADGKLSALDENWTNYGTRKWCWDEEE